MTNPICLLAWAAVLLLAPFVFLFWLTESKPFKIRRWRRQGQTWKAIATKLGCSQSTARRWATA
jgi:hypothetical protein